MGAMNIAMKILVLIAALLMPLAAHDGAHAASPEENYLAARDATIKTLAAASKRGVAIEKLDAQQARALADLGRQLGRIVGAAALKDAAGEGKINLETLLQGDQDLGMLDGIAYVSKDGKTRTVVTTQNLLKAWLRENKDFRDGDLMPQGMAPALRWAPFYSRALGGGAAFGGFAEIPVGSDKGLVTALLVARAQDIGSRQPDELVVATIRGARVFIVTAPAAAALPPVPACEAVWPELEKKTKEFDASSASNSREERILGQRRRKLEDDTDAAYRRCFADNAPRDPNFKTLVAQAQAIVDGLPVK